MKHIRTLAALLGALVLAALGSGPAAAYSNQLSGGGTVTYDTSAQKFGTGALSGGYGYSSTSNLPASGAFTAECWFKYSSTAGTQVFLGQSSSYWIGFSGGSFVGHYGFSTNEVTLTSSTTPTANAWHHAALTVDPSAGGKLYLDGALVASSAVGGTAANVTYLASSTNPFSINNFNSAGGGWNYQFPGEVDEVATWSGVKYTAAFTPPTAPYTGSEGELALYHLDINGADSSQVIGQAIAPTNAALLYSAYNWDCASSAAVAGGWCGSINAGAYMRTLFTGATCSMGFNVASQNSTYPTEIYYRVDGYEAQTPWVKAKVAASVACTPSSDTTNSNYSYHLLEMVVKSTSQNVTRWANPSPSELLFTGLVIANGATLKLPASYPKHCLFYLDSRGEGVRVVNQTAVNDADQNDVLQTWAYHSAEHLGCEPSIVAFGSQGLTVTGSGGVPALPSSFAYINAGVARTFSPAPDLIVEMEAANDYNAGATAAAVLAGEQTLLAGLQAAAPSAKIVVLGDFVSGAYQTQMQAAASAAAGTVSYLGGSTGLFNAAYGADSLNLHPTGANDMGLIAPQMTSLLQPVLAGAPRPIFRPTFH